MTRKIKELFLKYFKSNLAWNVVKFFAILYNNIIRIFRIFQYLGFNFGPLLVWNKSTKEWIKNRGASMKNYSKIHDSFKNNFNSPKTIDKIIHPIFHEYINEISYEQFAAKIESGKILGTYTNVTLNNYTLWDSTWYLNKHLYSNPYTYKINLGKFDKIEENIALLSGNDGNRNYNHWMTFVLPKFYLFQKSGFNIDLYATSYNTKFHKESIKQLGITEKQLLIIDENTKIQAKNLIIASTTTICNNMPEWSVEFIRNLFLDRQYSPSKRLYLSRINNRKVCNENEIVNYLKKYGFEKIILDNMSIKNQAKLFNSAEFIIGPHGAGFTNLLFCNKGTKVIELFHEKTVWGHYFCLSNSCGLDYYYLIGDLIKDSSKIEMDQDMYISLDKLEKTLNLAGIK